MIASIFKLLFEVLLTLFVSILELLTIPFNRRGRLFHALARFHSRWSLLACGVKVKVEGLERIDFSRSYIYVSNHASFFDIPAVISGIPDQIRIVYKKELEVIPLFGWGLKLGKTYIAIDRKQGHDALQSLEEAASKIRTGDSVLLFAEGTRTPDGNLQPFKRGPFNLAVKAGVPIVPVTILGSYKIMPRHSWRIRPGTIRLILSEPVEIPQANGKSAEFELRDKVHAVIAKHFERGE